MTPHLVIAGGGITGLAAAYAVTASERARARGIRCTLVETAPRLGGKILTEHADGCVIEHGPDSLLATKPWAADLCREVGLGDRLIPTQPGRAVYVWYRGRLHPLPEGMAFGIPTRLGPMVRTGLLSPVEKLRAAADLILPRRGDAEDETIGAQLRRRLGDAVVDRLAGPLLGGIYAGDPDALSVRATFPLLAEWEAAHRSLIIAALARRRARDAAATAVRTSPAHGPGASGHERGPSPLFLGLAGGLGEMVERVDASLERTVRLTGRTVRRIARDTTRPAAYRVTLDNGHVLGADAVLLATPAYVSAELLEPLVPSVAAVLRQIPYVSTAAVTMAFRRAEVAHPVDGHGFVVARGSPLAITACTWVSSKWPHRAPPELVLVRCYVGRAGEEEIVNEDDDRLVAVVRADLRTTMGIAAHPVLVRVARWPRAMPQYPAGHLERLDAIDTGLQQTPGLALAGAAYRGIGIPDCVRQGTEAAHRLLMHIIGEDGTV
ncbi:MAG: protoporphyrinogen oxidase [Armatimonadota bacterium]|nr:protoporphyrinogen oxidase [Armatimonadota bacterium]